MRYTIFAVGQEPLALQEAKDQLSVDSDDWDDLIEALIAAARESAEHYTGLTLVQKRVIQYFDKFPDGGEPIELAFSPIRSLQSIQYIDQDGATQTLSTSNYRTDLTEGLPARITEAYSTAWPATRTLTNAVIVTYDVGPRSLSDIPSAVKAGMKLEISEWFDNRKNNRQSSYTLRDGPAQALYSTVKKVWM